MAELRSDLASRHVQFTPDHALLEPELPLHQSKGLGGRTLEHEAPDCGLGVWGGADGYQKKRKS